MFAAIRLALVVLSNATRPLPAAALDSTCTIAYKAISTRARGAHGERKEGADDCDSTLLRLSCHLQTAVLSQSGLTRPSATRGPAHSP